MTTTSDWEPRPESEEILPEPSPVEGMEPLPGDENLDIPFPDPSSPPGKDAGLREKPGAPWAAVPKPDEPSPREPEDSGRRIPRNLSGREECRAPLYPRPAVERVGEDDRDCIVNAIAEANLAVPPLPQVDAVDPTDILRAVAIRDAIWRAVYERALDLECPHIRMIDSYRELSEAARRASVGPTTVTDANGDPVIVDQAGAAPVSAGPEAVHVVLCER